MASPEVPQSIAVEFPGCDASPVELTRENATLYTFWGAHAIYDHVFVHCSTELHPDDSEIVSPYGGMNETIIEGHYIFKNEPRFAIIAAFMRANNFRQILNMEHADISEIEAYDGAITDDAFDAITAGFNDDGLIA